MLFGQSLDSICSGTSMKEAKTCYSGTDNVLNEWASVSMLRIPYEKGICLAGNQNHSFGS
jgi:hypothetical protein